MSAYCREIPERSRMHLNLAAGLRTVAIVSVLLASLYLVMSGASAGNVLIVDDDGGSWADHDNIQDAVDAAGGDWTILVYEGHYYEQVVIDAALSLEGNGSSESIVDGNGTDGSTITIEADGVYISGMGITGGGPRDWQDAGVDIGLYNGTRVSNCSIYENERDGILIHYGNENVIRDSTIAYNKFNGTDLIDGAYNEIVNCTIFNNSQYGIIINGGTPDKAENNTIVYSTFYDNSNNHHDIYILGEAEHNEIHHNNFDTNVSGSTPCYDYGERNDWDDGSAGNYWASYDSTDSNGDGIGDDEMPVTGNGGGVDRYPLMEPNGTGGNRAPYAQIDSISPSPAYLGETITFKGRGEDEDGYIVRYVWSSSIDGEFHNDTSANTTFSNLSIGEHNITFRAMDNASAWSGFDAEMLQVKENNTAPEAVIDAIDPNSAEEGADVTFYGNGTDVDGEVVKYKWESSKDGLLFKGEESSFTSSDLSVGDHVIYLMVMDDDGAWSDEVSAELTINGTVENHAPTIEWVLAAPSNVAYAPYNVEMRCNADDTDGEIVRYYWKSSIDGMFYNGNLSEFNNSNLSVGYHSIHVKVMDDDGAWSDYETMNFTVLDDNEAPTAEIISITPNPAEEEESVTFTGSGNDTDGEVVWYFWYSFIDGELYEGNESSFSTSDLSPGNHTIKFKVRDDGGATSDYVFTYMFVNGTVVDNQRPVSEIHGITPNPAEYGENITFEAAAEDDDGEVVKYYWHSSIDGDIYYGTSPEFIYSGLSSGNHTIKMKAMDDDGAWSDYDDARLLVNGSGNGTGKPEAMILEVDPGSADQGEYVTFEGSGSGGTIVKFKWRSDLDGDLYYGTHWTFATKKLSNGTHTIYFSVMDSDGDWSDEVSVQVTINGLPWAYIVSISPNPALYEAEVTFSARGVDDGSIYKYLWNSSIDGELYEGTNTSFTSSELSAGTHYIHLWAVDDEGAWSNGVKKKITVNRAPSVTITSHWTGSDVNGSIDLKGSASDPDGVVKFVKVRIDNGSWKWANGTTSWSCYVDTTGLDNGNHTFTAIAFDGYHYSDEVSVVLDVYNSKAGGSGGSAKPLIAPPDSSEQGVIAGMVVAGALVAFAFTGIGYYMLLSLVFPLYSKLRSKKITDQKTRGKLVEYILENPGAHFSLIKKQLALPNGSAGYHLRVLETAGFVKSRNDGFRKRFYPFGYKVPEFSLDGAEVRIVEIVGARPGITQEKLAHRLKVTQPAVSYHLKALRKKGVVVTGRNSGTRLTNDYLGIMNSDRVKEKPEVGKPGRAPAQSKR